MPQEWSYIPIDKATLVDLYWDQGLTLKEIGEKLGASLRTVHRRMMEADVPRRNLGSRPAHGDLPQRPAKVLTPKFLTKTYEQKRMTMKQIAEQTGFSVGSVRRYLISAGIPIRTARYQIERRELAKLWRQGFNSKQIAEQYGCSVTTVRRALRRYGLVGR